MKLRPTKDIVLYNGDCLEIMKSIPTNSIDMILCDLPYERTKNKWDSIIPLDLLWKEYNRIIKNNGCISLFADGLFMVDLINSNRKNWRYNLIWDKVLTSGFLNANRQPLRQHEEIVIFYKKQPTYNPQFTEGKPLHGMGSKFRRKKNENNNYGDFNSCNNPSAEREGDTKKYPKSILTFPRKASCSMLHPTEKSLEVCEWLIKTYTNKNDVVLDNCMGSGTTGIACKKLKRRFIGIEIEESYFNLSKERIEKEESICNIKFIENQTKL